MRPRIAEFANIILCVILLLVIPLIVAVIVASPFAAYHVVLRGWKAGWIDLMESKHFIVYSWALLVVSAVLWSIVTYFWNRKNERSALPASQDK